MLSVYDAKIVAVPVEDLDIQFPSMMTEPVEAAHDG